MTPVRLQRLENLKYEDLRGFEKAAILINYLGPDAAKRLFKFVDDGDIRKLLGVMQKYRIVPVEVTKRVLEEYYELVSESADYIFSESATTKETVLDAVGEERARGILGHLSAASPQQRQLESLELVDAKSLSNFLINEHPQTIAVILAHLEPEKKGEVLKRLPESLQAEVVLRMSNLDHVAPELIAEVDRVLKQELSTLGTVDQSALGGVQPVAEMLNVMDKNTEGAIMSRIEEKDPILAEEIRKLMFVFEDIVKIDDKGIQDAAQGSPQRQAAAGAEDFERRDPAEDLPEHLAAGGQDASGRSAEHGPGALERRRIRAGRNRQRRATAGGRRQNLDRPRRVGRRARLMREAMVGAR